jgi:hypothetical protein
MPLGFEQPKPGPAAVLEPLAHRGLAGIVCGVDLTGPADEVCGGLYRGAWKEFSAHEAPRLVMTRGVIGGGSVWVEQRRS